MAENLGEKMYFISLIDLYGNLKNSRRIIKKEEWGIR